MQAFELAKAKLDVTELRNNLSQANKQSADKDADNAELRQHADSLQREIQQLMDEKEQLAQQLETVVARLVILLSQLMISEGSRLLHISITHFSNHPLFSFTHSMFILDTSLMAF